ncbi:hypothetical protein AVEN_109942-1 [Araneus ventricosus]|uniref:Uncharacterized protein n=1 Tax=Araneus ventricosus TaxID=182803 RepID=A0A4Y2XC13_ARAVE|nr:hypothetical protein AVEN_109942-1 [Araneus ventricosus]
MVSITENKTSLVLFSNNRKETIISSSLHFTKYPSSDHSFPVIIFTFFKYTLIDFHNITSSSNSTCPPDQDVLNTYLQKLAQSAAVGAVTLS